MSNRDDFGFGCASALILLGVILGLGGLAVAAFVGVGTPPAFDTINWRIIFMFAGPLIAAGGVLLVGAIVMRRRPPRE